ncbi:MAG: sigma-70 family RNA polymerase sigma factor [Oligoflexia bacterium]|nr:sigma-70 family RNA polymerase sigma factor [Oligoflexia bacterium]
MSDSDTLEAQLIHQILGGARDEFRLLVELHQTRIFSIIMKQVGNRSVAEELAAEAFERAYFNLKSFKFRSTFATWLTRIALNVTNNYFTSRRFNENLRNESFSIDTHELAHHSGDVLERAQYFRSFFAAFGTLSPKLRDVLSLCGLQGCSYEEAAEILKIPIGTVRSRLNQAREKLRRKLEELTI